jgi:hypothetical protein
MLAALRRLFRPTVIRHFRDEHIVSIGDRRVTVYTEMQGDGIDFVIDSGSIVHWMSPFDAETISSPQRDDVVRLLTQYFDRRGYKYTIQK